MVRNRVGGLVLVSVVVLVAVGTFGVGVATAADDDPFAVVPEGLSVDAAVDDPAAEADLADVLGVQRRAVRVDPAAGTVEVLTDDVTVAEFVDALAEVGVDVDEADVRDRPADATIRRFEEVLTNRYEMQGIDATVENRGDHLYVDPESRGAAARNLSTSRGVELWATVPAEDGYETRVVLTAADLRNVGSPGQQYGTTYVPVALTDDAGREFEATMRELGYDREGGTTCGYDNGEPALEQNVERFEDAGEEHRCLLTVVDGEVVYGAAIAPSLAASFREGDFRADPRFRTLTPDYETAEELERWLRTGPLPAEATVRPPEEVDDEDGDGGSSDPVVGDGAGLGAVAAVVAVLAAVGALLARRRPGR